MTDFVDPYAFDEKARQNIRAEEQARHDATFAEAGAKAHTFWRGLADALAALSPMTGDYREQLPGRWRTTADDLDSDREWGPVTATGRRGKIARQLARAVELADTIAADYRRELASVGVRVDEPAPVEALPDERDRRAAMIAAARQMLDVLDADPTLPIVSIRVGAAVTAHRRTDAQRIAEVDRVAAALGVTAEWMDTHYRAERDFFSDNVHYDVVAIVGPENAPAEGVPDA